MNNNYTSNDSNNTSLPIRFEEHSSNSLAIMQPLRISGYNSQNNRRRDSEDNMYEQERDIDFQQLPPPSRYICPNRALFQESEPEGMITPCSLPSIKLKESSFTDDSLEGGFIPLTKNITIDLSQEETCFVKGNYLISSNIFQMYMPVEITGDSNKEKDGYMPTPPNPSNIPYDASHNGVEPITCEPVVPLNILPIKLDKALLDKENHGKEDNICIKLKFEINRVPSINNSSFNVNEIMNINATMENEMYEQMYIQQQQQHQPYVPCMMPMNPQMGVNMQMGVNPHINMNPQLPMAQSMPIESQIPVNTQMPMNQSLYTKILPKSCIPYNRQPQHNSLPINNRYNSNYPMTTYYDNEPPPYARSASPISSKQPIEHKTDTKQMKTNENDLETETNEKNTTNEQKNTRKKKGSKRGKGKTKPKEIEELSEKRNDIMWLIRAATESNCDIEQEKQEKSTKSSNSRSTDNSESTTLSPLPRSRSLPPSSVLPVEPNYDTGYYPQKSSYNKYIGYMTHMSIQVEEMAEKTKPIKRQRDSNKLSNKRLDIKKEDVIDVENDETTTTTTIRRRSVSPPTERSPIHRSIPPQLQQQSYSYPINQNYGMFTTPATSSSDIQTQYKLSFKNTRPLHEASEKRNPLPFPQKTSTPPKNNENSTRMVDLPQPPPLMHQPIQQTPPSMPVASPYMNQPHQVVHYSYPAPPPLSNYQSSQSMNFYPRQQVYPMQDPVQPQTPHYQQIPPPLPHYYSQRPSFPIQSQPPQPQYIMQNEYYQDSPMPPMSQMPQMGQYVPRPYMTYPQPPPNL